MFNEIAQKFPNIQFTWIGDGNLRNELTSSNIKITGWKERKEVLFELNKNDIFLLPSLWEGLPISLLEAMYMEKICIVSDCIGNRDVIRNNENGYIAYSVDDYEKIIKNIIDESIIFKLKKQAKQDILDLYNTDKMIEQYNELYGLKKNNKKVKVLQYTERWGTGGIESFIMNLYRNIDLNKFSMDLLTSQNESTIYDEEINKYGGQKNVTLETIYTSPITRVVQNLKIFRKKIRTANCDILHLNVGNGVSLIYAYLAKKEGIKRIIVHSHNTGIKKENYIFKIIGHEICKRLFSRYATDFFACSDKAAQWLFTKKYLKDVTIINNGIYVDKYQFSQTKREQLRKELHIDDKLVIGNIGRFTEQKNHTFLIDIFKYIHLQNKNTVLLLIGEGELEDNIKSKVKQLGMDKEVIFFGTTNKIPNVLSAMDVFILPSLYEGNPVVGVEAQASGLPCFFSTSITKYAQITSNAHYISLNEKPEEWSKKILETNINTEERKIYTNIVKNAGFDIKDVTKKIEKIYFMEKK